MTLVLALVALALALPGVRRSLRGGGPRSCRCGLPARP